jgi:hypothetical protein
VGVGGCCGACWHAVGIVVLCNMLPRVPLFACCWCLSAADAQCTLECVSAVPAAAPVGGGGAGPAAARRVQLPAFTNNHVAFIARLTQASGAAAVNRLLVAPGKKVAGTRITREHLRKLFRKVIKKAVKVGTPVSGRGLDGHWSNIGRKVLRPPRAPMAQFNSSVGSKVKNLYATVSTTVQYSSHTRCVVSSCSSGAGRVRST